MNRSSTATGWCKMQLMAGTSTSNNSSTVMPPQSQADFHVLAQTERAILTAVFEYHAGCASDVSALVQHFDEQLAGPQVRLLPACRQGCAALDQECRSELAGRTLADLDMTERNRFLRGICCGHRLTAFLSMIESQYRREARHHAAAPAWTSPARATY
jgi:hypothetical protein